MVTEIWLPAMSMLSSCCMALVASAVALYLHTDLSQRQKAPGIQYRCIQVLSAWMIQVQDAHFALWRAAGLGHLLHKGDAGLAAACQLLLHGDVVNGPKGLKDLPHILLLQSATLPGDQQGENIWFLAVRSSCEKADSSQ